MCIEMVPPSASEALELAESLLRSVAGEAAAGLPTEAVAGRLQALERVDAIGAALRGRYLKTFDAQDGSVADGPRAVPTRQMAPAILTPRTAQTAGTTRTARTPQRAATVWSSPPG